MSIEQYYRKRIISFRARSEDVAIIEEFKKKEGGTIRTVSDADVIRHALSLIGTKKGNSAIKFTAEEDIYTGDLLETSPETGMLRRARVGNIENIPNSEVDEAILKKTVDLIIESEVTGRPIGSPEIIPKTPPTFAGYTYVHRTAQLVPRETVPMGSGALNDQVPILTEEQKALGYQYLKGELCDKDGFPVDQANGDYVERGGEIYATDPGRSALKEEAKANAETVVTETELGKMNPAMAELLGQSEKVDTLKKHAEAGMLSQEDGVDEEFTEDNFINE